MQTFLPYPDFYLSASVLDWKGRYNRLDNQINEATVILKLLLGEYKESKKQFWLSHPVFRMWENYTPALALYGIEFVYVWEFRRGISKDPRKEYFQKVLDKSGISDIASVSMPPWLGNKEFHASHRSVLLAKNPKWYSQFGWKEKPAVRNEKGKWPYVWPVRSTK